MQGWIYIATNKAFPQFIKIGESEREPALFRIPELQSTGVPEPFNCEYQVLVSNYEGLESKVHKTLDKHRNSRNREFFTCSVSEAIATIRELANIESESDFRSETIKAQELLVARNLALATRDVLDDFEKVLSSRQEYMLIKTPAIDPPGVTDYLTTYIGSIFFGFIVGAFIYDLGGFEAGLAKLIYLVSISVVLYFGHSSVAKDHRKHVAKVAEVISKEAIQRFPGLHEMTTAAEEVINAKRICAKANSIEHAKRQLEEEISKISKQYGVKNLIQHRIEVTPDINSDRKHGSTPRSIELVNKHLADNMIEYARQFGHTPPADALKHQPTDLLDRQATSALRRNKPIASWLAASKK